MSEFLITDEALNELICHSCLKYLSVLPVKLYPNGKIKCGRCVRDGDGGIVSLYEIVAARSFFPCVNRLDGCISVLQTYQVQDHESECESCSHKCPYCKMCSEIPTYLMVQHFMENHHRLMLDRQVLNVVVGEFHGVTSTYLFQLRNHLFFVVIGYYRTSISLTIFQLRTLQNFSEIKQNAIVITSDDVYQGLQDLDCTIVSDTPRIFKYDKISKESIEKFTINFLLNFSGYDFLLMENEVYESRGTAIEGNKLLSRFLAPTAMYSERSMVWPRKIQLSGKSSKRLAEVQVNWNSTAFRTPMTGNEDISINCVNCAETYSHFYVHNAGCKGFFIRNGGVYNVVCYFCYQYYKQICDNKHIPEFIVDYISYSQLCVWGCRVSNDAMFKHESNCDFQPVRDCPIEECSYKETLHGLAQHFSLHEPSKFSLAATFPIDLTKVAPEEYYVWLPPYFVLLKLKPFKNKFKIALSMCDEKVEALVVPQVLIFTSSQPISIKGTVGFKFEDFKYNGGIVTDTKWLKINPNSKHILIKCFLKYRNPV